ncbi:DMT family transporter [Pseudomonas donghuensis]|uniref:DMT family transporter n=1 Tax=Pseudomonas donghuensis TaxID=1163398 RepID=A0AAP0SA97_9PSED|nr:DMT family transporter [Pseudomonas donghuensis]KDN97206.1 DMT family transporter [Pseudomonas donghuensis]MCP6692800.1 DMT family transporter [Pseudomonas donghuensis]MDF9895546.1 drug/metabolite transporter (DMT)-like permease [Pseudomonas vranovensis]
MPRTQSLKIVLATLLVVLCWAYSPAGIHIALQGYDPGHLALARFIVASVFMASVAVWRGISLPRLKDLPLLMLLGLFAVFLHHVALNFGQRGISAGASSVLAQSTPLFSLLIACFVLRQKVSAWHWGCLVLGMLGAAMVVADDHGVGALDAHGLLVLLAALSWSIYFTLQKLHGHRYDGLTMVCYTLWAGTALLLVYLPGLGAAVTAAPPQANLAVLLLGVFPSALAYLGWAYVLSHSDVSRASMALYLIPPCALLIAAVLLGEQPSLLVVLGALVVLSSVLALNLTPGLSSPRPARQISP